MIRLSLCMIVKNEEAVLTRVLASAIQFADEILVADLDDVKYFFFHSGYFYNNFWVNVFPCWYKRGGYLSREDSPSSGGE